MEDAGWCRVDASPDLPPRVSIARVMIDEFVAENGSIAGLGVSGGLPPSLKQKRTCARNG